MNQQHVEVVHDQVDANPQVLWSPVGGPGDDCGCSSASSLDEDGENDGAHQSVGVLARCADPATTSASRTGLVVGYVQSGKTLSFTTVISLARDNGFPLIVLLAGTKQNLHEQTAAAARPQDLAVHAPAGSPRGPCWRTRRAASASEVAEQHPVDDRAGHAGEVPAGDGHHRDEEPVAARPGAPSCSKKLAQHGVDLATTPVLVVDDEADQAGLNAAVQDDDRDATATYQAILDLRSALDRHTYLMYTATPQAQLLINLADVLSPDFVVGADAGCAATPAGEYFFEQHKDTFVRRLSTSAGRPRRSTATDEPPRTLELALASYYLVLAQRGDGPVSMLVHPSHTPGPARHLRRVRDAR